MLYEFVQKTPSHKKIWRANGSKVVNPSENIQARVLPSGASFVKADFQRNTVALAGQLSAGNTGTISFSPEAIDAINAQRAAGDTFIKLRLQAAVLTNNSKNDYMGYFTREQTNTDRHPRLTLSYTTGTSQSAPEVFYALNDHLRTTQAIADAQQTIVWRADYSPFGVVTVNEDVDGDGKTLAYNLRFPGQYKDEETGLFYNGHRYYDPGTGRYITSDPLGIAYLIIDPQIQMALFGETVSGQIVSEISKLFVENHGLNEAYSYAKLNPLLNTDPTGLACMSTMCARVPKFPKGLLPKKKDIEDCLKGKKPRDSLDEETREKAADYYQRASDALHRESSASNKAKNLNQARADYLKGKTDTPPGNMQNPTRDWDFYP